MLFRGYARQTQIIDEQIQFSHKTDKLCQILPQLPYSPALSFYSIQKSCIPYPPLHYANPPSLTCFAFSQNQTNLGESTKKQEELVKKYKINTERGQDLESVKERRSGVVLKRLKVDIIFITYFMIAVGYPIQQPGPALLINSDSDEESQKILANNIKLKNELCRNFLETGYCKYHDKCQFAHGIQELRQHQGANNKYKTKRCLSYFDKVCCSYGERCNFQHRTPPCEQICKKAKSNFRQVFWNARPRHRPF